jgi:hypothetical protein
MTAESVRRSGDPSTAVDMCRDALIRFPGHLSARVTLGWALLDLGRLREAQQEFETVRRQAPDNLAAIRGLAKLHTLHDNEAFHEDEVGMLTEADDFDPLIALPPPPSLPPAPVKWSAPPVAMPAPPLQMPAMAVAMPTAPLPLPATLPVPAARIEEPVAQFEMPVARFEMPLAPVEMPVAQEEMPVVQEEMPVVHVEMQPVPPVEVLESPGPMFSAPVSHQFVLESIDPEYIVEPAAPSFEPTSLSLLEDAGPDDDDAVFLWSPGESLRESEVEGELEDPMLTLASAFQFEPVGLTEPVDPVAPVEPVEQVEPVEPVECVERVEPSGYEPFVFETDLPASVLELDEPVPVRKDMAALEFTPPPVEAPPAAASPPPVIRRLERWLAQVEARREDHLTECA